MGGIGVSPLSGSISPPYSETAYSPAKSLENSDSCAEELSPGIYTDNGSPMDQSGMLDKSRLGLCMILFSVVMFNPMGGLMLERENYATSSGGGRSILESDSPMSVEQLVRNFSSSFCLYVFNLFILLAGLCKILAPTERDLSESKRKMGKYWILKRQSEREIENGSAEQALACLTQAASELGQPIPVSWLDSATSVCWQLIILLFYKMGILDVVWRVAGYRWGKERNWEVAQTYHQYSQVYTYGREKVGLKALAISLAAVNAANQTTASVGKKVEMYVMLLVSLKLYSRRIPALILRYILRRANEAAAGHHIDPDLTWLLTPVGSTFLINQQWNLQVGTSWGLTSPPRPLRPVKLLISKYRHSLLTRALQTILYPTQGTSLDHLPDILQSVATSNIRTQSLQADRDDVVVDWWISVFNCASLWTSNQMNAASDLYSDVDSLPTLYQECEDPVYVALLAAQTTLRTILDGETEEGSRMCNSATEFIEAAVRFYLGRRGEEDPTVKNILVLGLDWMFQARTLLWETSTQAGGCEEQLLGFQRDLRSLRKLAELAPWLHDRVSLQEGTLRLIANASPGRTQHLLQLTGLRNASRPGLVCIGGKEEGDYRGEREHALAVMLACRHLPSQLLASPGERTGMLTEAARLLEKIGDKRRLHEVSNLIKTLSTNCYA